MTPAQKGLLLAALLFAALFIGALVRGSHQPGSGARDTDFAKHYQPPAWLKKPGSLFSPPRIGLPGPTLTVRPAVPFVFDVAPSKASFRTAKLRLQEGMAIAIDYADRTEGGPDALRQQSTSLPREGVGDTMQTTIIALKQGGTLTVRCVGLRPCLLATE